LRLTQINLAGFKSFVDPTNIPVPGQLVGIVGPNGCGKSNVIDAVRWVLGETSAKHLRGETMQDVLFNGSGERKPVNRASVELIFDNSLGKAAGQWSRYGEISIKRVLQREGDSSYYINNIHVRRRDIADLFLGTGLGARAYAIIEQGMISRVIEAKPEELRVFLEEAAGVSRYRERRRETELRLRDTRENLRRVDDIREELTKQVEHLTNQAEVAQRYHALQAQLGSNQNLLWLTRRNEAAAARGRHTRDIERLGIELEAETARLREAEKRLEDMRARHYQAGDALHAAQGALYEVNAETARLQQQIEHLRENRQRIESRIAGLQNQITNSEQQLAAAEAGLETWRGDHAGAVERLNGNQETLAVAEARLPLAEAEHQSASEHRDSLQQVLARVEQTLQVEQTKLSHAVRVIDQLTQRQGRLDEERAALPLPDEAGLERLRDEVAMIESSLQELRENLAEQERQLPVLEQELRLCSEQRDAAQQERTGTQARRNALQALQDRLSRGAELQDWLAARSLTAAPRVWQGITIEPGWEDALEAVLRERLNGIAVQDLDEVSGWLEQAPPGKIAAVETRAGESSGTVGELVPAGLEPLARYVSCRNADLAGAIHEWLDQVYVVPEGSFRLEQRGTLPHGALLVTREGHVCTRFSLSFHAPDTELHGVLTRQREIEELDQVAEEQQNACNDREAAVSSATEQLSRHRALLSESRQAVSDGQQRHNDMRIEAMRLSEQSQRLTERGEQIAAELADIAGQLTTEAVQREAAEGEISRMQDELAGLRGELEQASAVYRDADGTLRGQREALAQAQHAHQDAVYQEKLSSNKINELEGSIRSINEVLNGLREGVGVEQQALVGCDETEWQAQLQQALSVRAEREQALAQARDALEGLETELKAVEQERFTSEQKLEPLRNRIGEVRLKEQEARLTEEQYAAQLAEAGALEEELLPLLEKGMRSSTLQTEINRITEEVKALGAVNLAALEELQSSQERKTYLDAQSGDLTEAMTTLEDAIRRIDRETRERLMTTFDEVNSHFSKMFPALFGGGNARLELTGEEILDSGVQVIAQPPGKKNRASICFQGVRRP